MGLLDREALHTISEIKQLYPMIRNSLSRMGIYSANQLVQEAYSSTGAREDKLSKLLTYAKESLEELPKFGSSNSTISTSENANNFGSLSLPRDLLTATSNGTNDRGVFGGGRYEGQDTQYNIIDYITISDPGNAHVFGTLRTATVGLSATSNDIQNKAIFGGGVYPHLPQDNIDTIDITTSMNANNFGDLLTARSYLSVTSNGTNNRGVFGGESR